MVADLYDDPFLPPPPDDTLRRFMNKERWITGIRIADMEPSHRRNALRWVRNRAEYYFDRIRYLDERRKVARDPRHNEPEFYVMHTPMVKALRKAIRADEQAEIDACVGAAPDPVWHASKGPELPARDVVECPSCRCPFTVEVIAHPSG